jgi:hypothetical protein
VTEIEQALKDTEFRLERTSFNRVAQEKIVERKRAELVHELEILKRLQAGEKTLYGHAHALRGLSKDCAHNYRSEPSGRGVGFDMTCAHCGHHENPFPVF